jgi:hypothetical protein
MKNMLVVMADDIFFDGLRDGYGHYVNTVVGFFRLLSSSQ